MKPIMRPKYRAQSLFLSLVVIGMPLQPCASDDSFTYFSNSELDFWKAESSPHKTEAPIKSTPESGVNPSRFPWKKYLDPKNDEFFREGDYTPPAPFMEIARNPSDENISNWFRYLEMKNDITQRLQARLSAYASRQTGSSVDTAARVNPPPVLTQRLSLDPDAKRFRLRLYFDSKCPHCERMMGTLRELAESGYWTELRQIDSDVSVRNRIPFPVTSASPTELKQYQIQAVPLLLVGDLKQGTFFKIQGYQPTEAVLQVLKTRSEAKSRGGQL